MDSSQREDCEFRRIVSVPEFRTPDNHVQQSGSSAHSSDNHDTRRKGQNRSFSSQEDSNPGSFSPKHPPEPFSASFFMHRSSPPPPPELSSFPRKTTPSSSPPFPTPSLFPVVPLDGMSSTRSQWTDSGRNKNDYASLEFFTNGADEMQMRGLFAGSHPEIYQHLPEDQGSRPSVDRGLPDVARNEQPSSPTSFSVAGETFPYVSEEAPKFGSEGKSRNGSAPDTPVAAADVAAMEAHYLTALTKDPKDPLLLRNFARFLYEVKGKYEEAEKYFERAITESPYDGELLVQYAKLLWEGMGDANKASVFFERAVNAAPQDCYVLAAYASFLWNFDSLADENTSVMAPAPPFLPATSAGCG
ncbi:hypothetical protein CLOM_g288 [Closterium sp. NIES-68]|nr:hypothetical protein CLOM_g288 [Closterium sp. NIES-68]GJP76426.1 hypothetical protein CLOP_g6876 [Closterium sp. NIES-67]